MQPNKLYAITGILLVILFLAGCAAPALPPTPLQTSPEGTPPPLATASAGDPAAGEGPCSHIYYPTREGATWTYRSTGGPAGEYTFTDTITASRPDGFTLSTRVGDVTRLQQWTCTAEGLSALQLGGAPAAMLNSQNIQLALDMHNITGVTFPSQIQAGQVWQQTMDVSGTATAFNQQAEAAGTVQMNFHALGTETVNVPAGTFEALKVQVDILLNVNAIYEGMAFPVAFNGSYTYWFAPGVGWVKSSGTGSVLGSSFTDVTELQSYSIP